VAGPIAPLISRTAATPAADAAAAWLTPGEPAAGARTAVGVSAATNVADIAAQVTAIAHSRPTRRDFTIRTLLPAQTRWQLHLSAVFFSWTFPPRPAQRNALARLPCPPIPPGLPTAASSTPAPAARAERAAGLCAVCGTGAQRCGGLPTFRRCRRAGMRAPAAACRSR